MSQIVNGMDDVHLILGMGQRGSIVEKSIIKQESVNNMTNRTVEYQVEVDLHVGWGKRSIQPAGSVQLVQTRNRKLREMKSLERNGNR